MLDLLTSTSVSKYCCTTTENDDHECLSSKSKFPLCCFQPLFISDSPSSCTFLCLFVSPSLFCICFVCLFQ